jgi:hypothetical protein
MIGNFGDFEASSDGHLGRHREFARHSEAINIILLFKNFFFHFSEICAYLRASRSLRRGASANRHERWGRDAMDAEAVQDERGRCGRRNRVVLISRRWDQVGGR